MAEIGRRHFIAAGLALPFAGRATAAGPARLLVVGDSLSAEYGLRRGSGWVALLERRLAAEKLEVKVVNASISGDTTSGGRSRLPALLSQHQPTHVVIELGGNDALRGLPLAMTQENLSQMTQTAQKAGARVLLVGIQLPPNYGADYGARFAALYEQVAQRHQAAVVPFLLKGVADVPDAERLFQPDRIHPTEQAQSQLLANVWPELRKLLAAGAGTRP
ncbi:arylesterase [Ramlibacter sp.]|jgi:acyl-CoA thioesterase-1|uniref:arylesterase n=1 Tax=Ramlibacter sp. TaxID=1917967 RepID=UPI0039C8F190